MGDHPSVDDLQTILRRQSRLIEAMPEVLGTGIGLSGGRPVIQVFVSGEAGPHLVDELSRMISGDFEIISQEGPANASGD